MQAVRFCWGPQLGGDYNFEWDIIKHNSFVLVTVSEGRESVEDENGNMIYTTLSPERFTGAARFTVHNISPYDKGVTFKITIDWDPPDWDPWLTLWTDIIVFDEFNNLGYEGFSNIFE